MTSWQTRAVSLYLHATRKNPLVVQRKRADPLAYGSDPAPPPRRLRDRLDVEWVAGCGVVRVQPAGGAGGFGSTGRRSAVSGPTTEPEVLVYFHGGAFRSGIARQHWDLIGELADATGRDVLVPRYGLLPEHTADDALLLLRGLHQRLDGTRVHLLGDSAGGNLALLAAQAWAMAAEGGAGPESETGRGRDSGVEGGAGSLRASGPEVVGVTLIAPWLDLSLSNPRIPEVARVDPWLDPESVRPLGTAWAAGRDTQDLEVSPLFGELVGLPPTAVVVGSRDVCLPDCEELARRAPAVRLHVEEGSPHVFPLLPTPEGRAGRAAIARFVRETFAGA